MAVRTDSGTLCSLIDSDGGGAAGKGRGRPDETPLIEPRERRCDVGEPETRCRGGEATLIDERREMDEPDMLIDGEGGEPTVAAKPDGRAGLRDVGVVGEPRMSTPKPESPLDSRERRLETGLSSPDACRTAERPLARPTDVRTRAARAVRAGSCSGELSRASGVCRVRGRAAARGVSVGSAPAGEPVSGSSAMPVGGENSRSAQQRDRDELLRERKRTEKEREREHAPPKGAAPRSDECRRSLALSAHASSSTSSSSSPSLSPSSPRLGSSSGPDAWASGDGKSGVVERRTDDDGIEVAMGIGNDEGGGMATERACGEPNPDADDDDEDEGGEGRRSWVLSVLGPASRRPGVTLPSVRVEPT